LRLIDILVDELKLTSTFVGDIAYYPDGAGGRDLRAVLLMREPQSFGICHDRGTRMGSQLFNSQINTNKVPRRKA
jgi:hypothetical protein